MNTQNLALGLVAVLLAIGAGYVGGGFNGTETIREVVRERFAAAAGPTHFELQEFVAGYTYGGVPCVSTSTTAAVGTLQATGDTSLSNRKTSCIDFTANQVDVTLTLAASTTAWYPQGTGVSKRLLIRNASTTAAMDIILAAGTGINLKGVATSSSITAKTITGDTGGDNYAVIEFIRQADTDINAHFVVYGD